MKLCIDKTEMTQAEAEAAQTKTKRLMTSSEFFKIPKEQYLKEVYPFTPLRIENGLVARSDVDGFGYVRQYVGVRRPSDRFGGLYVVDEKPHVHKFVKQPKKCECGLEG